VTIVSMLALGILAGIGVAILGRVLQGSGSVLSRTLAAIIGLALLGWVAWLALQVLGRAPGATGG
jgi:hypothetical protein